MDVMYKCHYKELDGIEGDLDNLMRENFEVVPNKFINLTPHTITLNNGHPSGVANKFSNFCCGISSVFYGDQKRAQFISCQHCCSKRER